MDRYKKIWTALPSVILPIVLTLSGCGGGGGGASNNSDNPLTYTGNTSPAVITSANAKTLITTLLEIDDLALTFPNGDLAAAPAALSSVHQLRQLRATVSETEPCFPSGRIDFSGNLDETTGTGSLKLRFYDCQDGDITLDGSADWVITAANIGDGFWQPTDSTMTMHRLAFIGPDINLIMDGSLREQLSQIGETTLTLNVVTQDRLNSRMMKTENLVLTTRFGESFYLSQEISGRVYDSIDGYLDLTTPIELRFTQWDSPYPSSGQLLISGANGAQLRLSVLSEELTRLSLNLDGDAIFEVTGELPWTVINRAESDPNDIDGDGIADSWEAQYGLDSSTFADASQDGDADSLSSYQEFLMQSDPTSNDSDGDGMKDGWEADNGFNLINGDDAEQDTDGDQATNLQEHDYDTDPRDITSTPADLALSLTSSSPTVSTQTLFEYRLQLINQGPGVARGAQLSLTLPTGVVVHTAVPGILPSPWDCSLGDGTLTCEPLLGRMNLGETVTIAVPVISSGTLGLANAEALVNTSTLDFSEPNNQAAVEVETAPALLRQIDLAINGSEGVEAMERPFRSAISPDRKHLYVPGIVDDAVAVFGRDLATGQLTFIEAQRDGIDTPEGPDQIPKPDFPKAVAVSPDGLHVYIATEWSQGEWIGSVIAFSRNIDSGQLTHLATYRDGESGIDGIAQAIALTFTDDGSQLYVAGPNDNAVSVFQRNPTSGLLSFSEAHFDGIDGVDGIAGAFDVVLSPDSQYLYVAGSLDNAVAIFKRDNAGLLNYVEQAGVTGFTQSLAISPDGEYLYCLADGVYAFSRDPISGALQLVATYHNDEQSVVGLEGMYELSLSPDGSWLVVAAQQHGAIGLFSRNSDTGELRFIETRKDGAGLDEGLGGAWSSVFSPDGNFLYVSAGSDNAVAGFMVQHENTR